MELGWNYMKFHPNSTPNSTMYNILIIKNITPTRWKGGTSFTKNIFRRIIAEKLVTTQVGMPYSYYDETIAA